MGVGVGVGAGVGVAVAAGFFSNFAVTIIFSVAFDGTLNASCTFDTSSMRPTVQAQPANLYPSFATAFTAVQVLPGSTVWVAVPSSVPAAASARGRGSLRLAAAHDRTHTT